MTCDACEYEESEYDISGDQGYCEDKPTLKSSKAPPPFFARGDEVIDGVLDFRIEFLLRLLWLFYNYVVWVRLFVNFSGLIFSAVSLIESNSQTFRRNNLFLPFELRDDHLSDELLLILITMACREVVQILLYLIVDLLLVSVFENHFLHSLGVLVTV